jgi:GrpB-like predicted nucleotidyltransferase (UPF0157 family)
MPPVYELSILSCVAVQVDDYDTQWPIRAEAAIADLIAALPGRFVEIEHIGSTSVPGLAAKPIIDLMASVGALDDVIAVDSVLASLGYLRTETGMSNRLFYARDDAGRRTHHLHVVTADTWPTRNERLLRDHLRTHAGDRARYATLKRELQYVGADDDAYTRMKTGLIQKLVDRARVDRGLAPVPVWED